VEIVFAPIYPDEIQISVSRIQILVNSYSERKRTGIIRLGYPSKKYLQLLFKRGELLNTYLVSPETSEPLLPGQWMKWAESAGDAYTKVVPLSTFGLFVSKLLITSAVGEMENFSRPAQLSEYIALLGKKAEPSLIQVDWDHAMGGLLFSGSQSDAHSIFLSQDTIVDEDGIHKNFSLWNETHCTVATIIPDSSVDVWQEYYLRRAFSEICGLMLSRFEVMTGRALVDSLVRLVSICAARNNLDIVVLSRKAIDHEVFCSPQDAAQNYRQILNEMSSHFSAVVGSRLLSSTMQEIVTHLSEHERAVIRTFELLPQGYFYE
jgi:hypothetical protein